MSRREKHDEKNQIIWEGIRRTPEYRQLYSLYKKGGKSKYQMLIYEKFGIVAPISPSVPANKIATYLLRMYFNKSAIEISTEDILKLNKHKSRFIQVDMTFDMNKSFHQLSQAFSIMMKSVKKNRKEIGLNKIPKKIINGKQKIHDYDIKDFETYEMVNKLRSENNNLTFYQIAKIRGSKSNKKSKATTKRMNLSDTTDAHAKTIENAYHRAKWVVDGGWRVLMH